MAELANLYELKKMQFWTLLKIIELAALKKI